MPRSASTNVRRHDQGRKTMCAARFPLSVMHIMYLLLVTITAVGVMPMFMALRSMETREPPEPCSRVSSKGPVTKEKNAPVESKGGRALVGGDHIDVGYSKYENATVLAMALGYDLETHQRFMGSLRNAGFEGNVIIAVEAGMSSSIRSYLDRQKVVVKVPERVECKFPCAEEGDDAYSEDDEVRTCFDPYPTIKARWSRFPLLRDYLAECNECSGPVLVTDYRDVFFQRNPFDGAHRVTGLQVFQEISSQRTTHWLVDEVVRKCKGVIIDEPMLCSGTTIGTRRSMLQYLGIMHSEMEEWMKDPNCACTESVHMVGDDQSVHNYLFYQGRFPNASAMPNRVGIVNTVGVQGNMIAQANAQSRIAAGMSPEEARAAPFDGSDMNSGQWLGLHYDLTDSEGFFTNFDGTRSCVVHQYDRFGPQLEGWMQNMEYELWGEIGDKCDAITSDGIEQSNTGGDGITGIRRQKVFVFPQNLKTDEHKNIFIDGISNSNRLELSSSICDMSIWFVDINQCDSRELKQAMRKKNNANNRNQTIILADWSDSGWGEYELAELFLSASDHFGNVHYVTRALMDHRNIQFIRHDKEFSDYGVKWSWDKEGAEFGLDGRIKVARHSVRSDVVGSISTISGVNLNGSPSSSAAIARLPRPKDVVSFWNPEDVEDPLSGAKSELRAFVSKLVLSLGRGIDATAGLAGEREGVGRNNVADAYARALLEHKIVVVAQRDQWEDHYRLMEALTGGALVMTDPMHPLPYLLEDGVNVIVYSSLKELREKILYYIRNEKERLEIATRGHHIAMNHHRSWHVMERIVLGNWTNEYF